MRPEISLLKILLDKDLYDSYRKYITINKDEQELKQLYSLLDKCIETHNRSLSFNEFYVYVLSNLVSHQFQIKTLLDKLEGLEIGKDIAETLLVQLKERNISNTIAIKAIEASEGKLSYQDLLSFIKEHETVEDIKEDEKLFVSNDLLDLYQNHIQKTGLRWRLRSLNKMLGSLRKGNFGFIFARPETGKTTFLASEMVHMASQLTEDDGPILWFNNEEDGKQVQLRIFQATFGITRQELFLRLDHYNQQYKDIIGNKLLLIDNAATHRRDVEKFCNKYNPSLVIFDQIDKVKGFDGDREDLKLGSIYQWAREISKSYCPVVGVTQADGSGENKKWLTMENVANAKTAKQAEADWILGIGASHADGFEYVRHLHASKNKLPGDEDSDPLMRHGKVDCIIEPETARFKDYE